MENKKNSEEKKENLDSTPEMKNLNESKPNSEKNATDNKPNSTVEEKNKVENKNKTITIQESEYLDLKQKCAEYWDRLVRMQADFDNARKRWERDKQEFVKFAQEEVLLNLLGIVDDFERSLKVSPTKSEDMTVFVKGIEMIFSHLQELLKKGGVTPMDAKGKIFNPNYHEALMMIEKDDVPENTILEEYQRGYFINNKVLRIAKVQLSKKKEQVSPKEEIQQS